MSWSYTIDRLARAINTQPPGDSTPFSRVSTDTRSLKEGDVFFALEGENFDGNAFLGEAFEKGAAAAVSLDEQVGELCLIVPDVLDALQRFATYHRRQYDPPVLAITGSCGKTSAKELVAAVLATKYNVVSTEGNFNNAIGCPLSILQLDAHTECAVLELGANHPGEIARLREIARPTEAAVTMVGPAHLEGFGDIEGVARAKAEILDGLGENGVFYVNANDEHCLRMAETFSGPKVYFGSASRATEGLEWGVAGGGARLESYTYKGAIGMGLCVEGLGEMTLPIHSRAHVANVLLAIAVGLRHGIETFEEALGDACRRTGRQKFMRVGPLEVIDDSYNANPSSVSAALETLAHRPCEGRRMAVLGAMLELGDAAETWHAMIGAEVGEAGVSRLFARGPHAKVMADAALKAQVKHAEALESHGEIARAIHECARPGDVLLVKGSRGMAMEKVIAELEKLYGTEPETT